MLHKEKMMSTVFFFVTNTRNGVNSGCPGDPKDPYLLKAQGENQGERGQTLNGLPFLNSVKCIEFQYSLTTSPGGFKHLSCSTEE